MTIRERQSIRALVDGARPTVDVLLYSQPRRDRASGSYRRLQMSQPLATEFLGYTRNFASGLSGDWTEKTFDPGYDPLDGEVIRVAIGRGDASQHVRSLRDNAADTTAPDIFTEGDEAFLEHLKLYAVVVASDTDRAVFVRKFKPSMRLKKSGFLNLTLVGNTFERLESEVFRFDKRFDCVIHQNTAFVHWQGLRDFLSLFDYYEQFKQEAGDVVDRFAQAMPIRNIAEFKEAATSDPRLMRMMVAAKGNADKLTNVPMAEIQQTASEFGMDGLVIQDPDDGELKLLWDRSLQKRWDLAYLLGDALVKSAIIPENLYKAPSKERVARRVAKKVSKKTHGRRSSDS